MAALGPPFELLPTGDLLGFLVAEQAVDPPSLFLEFGECFAAQRFAARQANAKRVDLGAVDDRLVVKVRPARKPVEPMKPITWPCTTLAPGITFLAMALWWL